MMNINPLILLAHPMEGFLMVDLSEPWNKVSSEDAKRQPQASRPAAPTRRYPVQADRMRSTKRWVTATQATARPNEQMAWAATSEPGWPAHRSPRPSQA